MTAKSLKGSQFTPSKHWLPILDPNAAEETQPQCHREDSCRKKPQDKADHQKPESYPLKFDDIWDFAKSKNGTTIIDGILDVLKIKMKGTLRTKVLAIVEHSTDHFSFAKKLVKLTGRPAHPC